MKKIDYLKQALADSKPNDLRWIISAFCLTREGPEDYLKDPYLYRLVSSHAKYKFINHKNQLEDIDDSDTKESLFIFREKIDVDHTWGANIISPIKTCIGNLIFNCVAILPAFGEKFPFQSGRLIVSDLEKYIAERLTDTPDVAEVRNKNKIYVDEYLKFRDNLIYLEQFAPLTNWSATPKGITKPTGIDEFRNKLLVEYAGRLNDRSVFAEYEGKLKAFDREYLKDDPAYGTFIKGKVLDISRKKMFLAIGIPETLDIKDPVVPITRTLEQGQPTDPLEFTASLNGARHGSYSRGTETINGGVVAKTIIRVSSNFKVDLDDCKVPFGITKIYNKDTIKQLIGRSIIINGEVIKVGNNEQALSYLDRPLIVRSPAYCRAGPGDRLCKVCSGTALSQHVEGLVIPLTELSSIVLTQSLKSMHGKVLSTAIFDLDSALT